MNIQDDNTNGDDQSLPTQAGYQWESKDGKYALKYGDNGVLWAYRYGEPWRNLVGDNLILTMLFEIEDMQKLLSDNERDVS